MISVLKQRLESVGVESSALEARWILEEYPHISVQQIDDIVARRACGEPLSRIFGWREFYGRRFDLNAHTLDPRPDSETLIDVVLKRLPSPKRILDLGTGTGCLLITLLCELPHAQGVGVDLSLDALSMAQQNAAKNKCDDRVQFFKSDWFENVTGRFDVILSNPPYIRSDVIPDLEESVKNFDPILALDGGLSGIEPYKKLFESAKKFLEPQGKLVVEIGFDQGDELMRLSQNYGATLIHLHKDLAGHDRVLEITF